MHASQLVDLVQHLPQTQAINQYANRGESLHLTGIATSFSYLLLAAYAKQFGKNHLVILPDKERAAYVLNDLQSLSNQTVLFLPDSFRKVNQFQEVDNHQIRQRTQVIQHLAQGKTAIVVTYPEAFHEQVPNIENIQSKSIQLQVGKAVNIDFTLDLLVELGFESTDFVYEPGQFSQRGGIIDIFSFGSENPYRIELFGNDIESIRVFDMMSQESIRSIQEMSILSNLQLEAEGSQSLLQLLPKDTLVWTEDYALSMDFIRKAQNTFEEFKPAIEQLDDQHVFAQSIQHFFTPIDLLENQMQSMVCLDFALQSPHPYSVDFKVEPQPVFNRNFDLLANKLVEFQELEYTICIASTNEKQQERFRQIFDDIQANIQFEPVNLNIHEGFINHDLKLLVFTDHQIFERYHKYQLKKGFSKAEAISLKSLMELQPGDYVTHIDHGIGQFSGLETIDVNGKKQEAIRLLYKNKDLLYVGINSLYKIAKYAGKEGKTPALNKLGSDTWQKLKNKTKKKVKDIANDLIQLYAKRKATKGFAFSPDSYLQLELESSFIYEDTPDQAATTIEVKKDMEKTYPMDRLVCGDVGFGKTEIAIRAAFKAVADSKQVAVLVPTTILALQHFKTFQKRLADFPCNIDYINRFKSAKEKKETLGKLERGEIDIIIGTHALAGKQVKFQDLGLLIIDEEQKFGVSVKEKLRQIKANVDTLTLTATPIPRTLQFSLMGARDLSIMRTPPPNRQPITTELKVFDEQLLKEAIEFEVYRGGQVFFVHNRVQNIHEFGDLLARILPEMRIGIAHGQMEGKQLEETLMDFVNQKTDVLLSTNIVESGLDIPNANTMIVSNAHLFGMSDLHQLRGRVGRSNKKAFCYLFAPPVSVLPTDSRKRLKTLEQFSDLGSGFQIAMRDLDIRGAGNILGAEQSGFISDIGLHTFHKILDEAVRELKQTEYKELFEEELISGKVDQVSDCQIDADVEMLIPGSYVNSRSERMLLYQELNTCKNETDITSFADRLSDRFGKIPHQLEELFDGLRLQWIAKQIGFERIVLKNGMMRCFFIHNPESPYFQSDMFGHILDYIQQYPNTVKIKQTPKNLSITFKEINSMDEAKQRLEQILQ